MTSHEIPRADWYGSVPRSARTQTLFGYSLLGLAVVGFGFWAQTATLAGAVVASGVFVTTGQNKIVQHLEGGVIREILVREGDTVERDQLLIELDETGPRAELRRLTLRHARLTAIEARLTAEIKSQDEVAFPEELTANKDDQDIVTILDSQQLTFFAKQKSMQSEIAALQEGINAFEQRVAGSKVQLAGIGRQIGFIEQDLVTKKQLLQSGLVRQPEVLALERARANLEGEIGRLTGEMGNAQEQMSRTREQIAMVRNTAVKTAVEQLHETRAELNDLRERMHASRRILDRVRITAPVRGVVVKLRYHTAGGVVEAGKNIMEIVPVQDDLIIEVRVRPQDIEGVKRGQRSSVRLIALNSRVTPTLAGTVVYVSADALPNEKAGQPGQQGTGDVYVARIGLNAGEIASLPNFVPTPGMPVEVYIMTAERTFLDYLLRPLKDTMSRAFREL